MPHLRTLGIPPWDSRLLMCARNLAALQLGSCYVFCKIPPIEAARWAWVFAWTPWIAENALGDKPEPDDISADGKAS